MSAGKNKISQMLSELGKGEEGSIVAVIGASRLACRLRELGLIPGVRTRILRSGCPIVIQVGETRLCLRKRDAAAIQVAPDPVF